MRALLFYAVAPAFLLTMSLSACSPGSASDSSDLGEDQVERPPQFVLLAFDGSLNLDFWNESRAFAKANNVKFTYFMSGVYFLADTKKSLYQGPHHNVGSSDIGFGGIVDNIPKRVEQVALAFGEGHEMGSHANGHFDGHTWSDADWTSEFQQFDKLIFGTAANNGVTTPQLPFDSSEVVGFRAPLLAYSPGLYTTLAARGFAYDTSRTSATNYWPQKIDGVWNFPLGQLRIVGSGKRTLSMDYNFYYADSGGQPAPANKEVYKQQMIDTYMQYFQSNYLGNRAPLHIGHHFSKWNGGAYWEAMQMFAQRVCNLPEVRCVTYRDLLSFVTEHEHDLKSYAAAKFPAMARPPEELDDGLDLEPEPAVADEDLESEGFVLDPPESHDE